MYSGPITIPENLKGKKLKVVTTEFTNDGAAPIVDYSKLSDYLPLSGGNLTGNLSVSNSDVLILSGRFSGGENALAAGKNSFTYGTAVSALGQNSYSVGINNVAGCYGWYYVSLSTDAKVFYLSSILPNQITTPRNNVNINMEFNSGLEVGDVISFVNFNKYDIGSTIVAISGNAISVDELPAGGGLTYTLSSLRLAPDHDDWSFFCPAKPLAGQIWLGEASYAAGINNKAVNAYSFTEGKDNIAYGQYSHAEGRNNLAGYASHAEGRETKAYGLYSHTEGLSTEVIKSVNTCAHAEGRETKALDRYAHAEGYLTEAKYNAHAEGLSSHAYGNCSHAEGEGTLAYGLYSHTEGLKTLAQNLSEHAQGLFNISNKNTLYSIGCGTADNNRKNAIEITNTGDIYIIGVGGYNGKNRAQALSLQQVINSLSSN